LADLEVDSTAHGECGEGQVTGYFSVSGKIYQAVVDLFWNRHDKQFYYHDGSDLVSFEEVTLTPAKKGAVQCLWETFGGTTTDKGYKMLDEHVGIIYGDSITNSRARGILSRLESMGFASGCVFFGRGSYEAVYNTRDSTGSAIKATYGEAEWTELELFKDPITDDGTKRSLKGLLRVENEKGTYVVYDQQTEAEEASGALQTVFEDGKLLVDEEFSTLRKRVGFINI
jgi:nicotinamide phosphoribosyltransferase